MIRGTLFAAILLAGCAALPETLSEAPEPVPNLGAGSYVYWTSYSDGASDKLIEKLLYQGDGFALYQTKGDFAAGDETDYFALFGGIDYRNCDSEMPTEEERAGVAALWPLEAGKSAKISTSGEGEWTIKVGTAKDFFLMGETLPAFNVIIHYEDDEERPDEELIVLADTPLTVSLRWHKQSKDTVTLVTKPKPETLADLTNASIGTCASLINQETQ